MTEVEYWVLHSPYPDKSWRGIEKCATDHYTSGPLMFETQEEVQAYLNRRKCDPYFVPVKIILQVPDIRGVLNV